MPAPDYYKLLNIPPQNIKTPSDDQNSQYAAKVQEYGKAALNKIEIDAKKDEDIDKNKLKETVNKAVETLSNPQLRFEHDQKLFQQQQAQQQQSQQQAQQQQAQQSPQQSNQSMPGQVDTLKPGGLKESEDANKQQISGVGKTPRPHPPGTSG